MWLGAIGYTLSSASFIVAGFLVNNELGLTVLGLCIALPTMFHLLNTYLNGDE